MWIVLYMSKLCVSCSIEIGGRSSIRGGGNALLDRDVSWDKFANGLAQNRGKVFQGLSTAECA